MGGVEDRLRDALHATAATVEAREPSPLPASGPRHAPARRWAVPVFAVVSVLLMVAAILVVHRNLDTGPDRRLQRPPGMPGFIFASVPAAGAGKPSEVQVRESATGRLRGSAQAPAGTRFANVAAAGDGRAFFAVRQPAGSRSCRFVIERFEVDETGRIVRRRPVGGTFEGRSVGDVALAVTPDGRRLTYAADGCGLRAPGIVGVVDALSGAERRYPVGAGGASNLSLSADGRTLFFARRVETGAASGHIELRRAAVLPSGEIPSLLAGDGVIRRMPSAGRDVVVTAVPDGRTLFLVEMRAVAKQGGTRQPEGRVTGGSDGSLEVAAPDKSFEMSPVGDAFEVISAEDGRQTGMRRIFGTSMFGKPIIKFDVSGRYLLSDSGLVDLRENGPPRVVQGLHGVFDADW
ncbi:hypothetical protein [Actinomadura macrotermitis]|uniref:Uncharacterized protein n=1 Tax=Actinomadura macrotermitis TaxID=2585200 RepID=A0A7K0C076_9ACTN|nr:hypothetical protein [Actinomadura macrotermitis]MQY06837.1 hypothetical protein [Actinomadura macrotermitis]